MSERANAIAAGLGLYVVLVMAFYAVERLALGTAVGQYLLSPAWRTLDAARAVVPGAAAGWLCSAGAVRSGAIVGGVGGLIMFFTFGVLNVMPFVDSSGRMTVEIVLAVLTSAFTNAIGGAAGMFLHAAKSPR